ncbi:MAG TPA: GtrA family protein, partial [Candidatus Dormibacteraeota bacterium]
MHVTIEDRRGLPPRRRLIDAEAPAGVRGLRPKGLSRRTIGQVARFSVVGAGCTLAYALLYSLLRTLAPAVVANLVALVATTIVNTAANRRFTFGMEGRAGIATGHAVGLVALALGAVTTNLAMAALLSVRPNPGPPAELAVLLTAGVIATLVRFLLLRTLMADRRPVPAPAVG